MVVIEAEVKVCLQNRSFLRAHRSKVWLYSECGEQRSHMERIVGLTYINVLYMVCAIYSWQILYSYVLNGVLTTYCTSH